MLRAAVTLVLALAGCLPAAAQSRAQILQQLDAHMRATVEPRSNRVSALVNGSPMARVRVKVGDLIVAYDGLPVRNQSELDALAKKTVGKKDIDVVVLRRPSRGKRKRETLKMLGGPTGATLVALPAAKPAWRKKPLKTQADVESWRARAWESYRAAFAGNLARSPKIVDKIGHGPNKDKPFDTYTVTTGGARLTYGLHALAFDKRAFKKGPPLNFIFHGGYNASYEEKFKKVNRGQYHTMQFRYFSVGTCIVPLAEEGGWAVAYMCDVLDRLIREQLATTDIDPDRVYAYGYSMGGFGCSYFGPILADRFAAIGASGGTVYAHNSPLANLRNTPIVLRVGEKDEKLSPKVQAYGAELAKLRKADPDGYLHVLDVQKGRPHHNVNDRRPTPKWCYTHTRNPAPRTVVWKQDKELVAKLAGQKHPGRDFSVLDRVKKFFPEISLTANLPKRFYWLGNDSPVGQSKVLAKIEGAKVTITSTKVTALRLRLGPRLIKLGKKVTVIWNGKQVYQAVPKATLGALVDSMVDRGDARLAFPIELVLDCPE